MKRVLFVCIHNSARSQMAEAFLKSFGGDDFIVESAGIESGKLNPLVVQVMREIGFDISGNSTKTADSLLALGRSYDYIITVCDAEAAARCPVFPGKGIRLHWWFDDPSSFTGTEEEMLARARVVRDQIKTAVKDFVLVANEPARN